MSSPFYPDNPSRKSRVEQLITQTSVIQAQFKTIETNINKTNDDAAKLVDQLAVLAGYSTTESYCEAGLNVLSPAQKQNYKNLCNNLVQYNSSLKTGQFVTGCLALTGTIMNIGIPKIVNIVCKVSTFVHGLRGILRGLVLMVTGAFQDGWAMVRAFATLIKGNYSRSLVAGSGAGFDITAKTASSLRWLKRCGKILQWGGLIAEVGMLIYTVTEQAKEKEMLMNAIIEACSSRFGAKKIELLLNQTMLWNSKMAGVVSVVHLWTTRMENQKKNPPANPKMVITQEDVDGEVKQELDKMINDFDKELNDCNPDDKVLGQLALLDSEATSGESSWTQEDPKIQEMKKWIEDHPLKDDKGNVVPIEGPSFHDIGLQWTAAPVKPQTSAAVVTFVAKNNTAKGQRFKALHFSFPVTASGASSGNGLFEGVQFAAKGASEAVDGSVEVVIDGAVINLNSTAEVRYKQEDGCVKVTLAAVSGTEPITLPKDASIKILVTGKTTAAGTTACLAREEWYPFGDKNWEDVIVKKE